MFTNATLTPEKVSQLKATYGDELRAVETNVGIILFRKPKRDEWDRWQDKNLVSKAEASKDARELCQACLAESTYEEMMLAINDKPGLLQGEFLTCLLDMAGAMAKDALPVKKL